MAAPGGWASALGAAILGGQQGYQDRTKAIAQEKTTALQQAILAHQVAEMPKVSAAGDMADIFKYAGDAATADPRFQAASQIAYGGNMPANPDVATRNAQRAAQAKFYTEEFGGGGQSVGARPSVGGPAVSSTVAPTVSVNDSIGAEPPVYNAADVHAFQRAKALGLPEPPLTESAEHKLWFQKKELLNKAEMKPPSAATERERNAYAKVRVLIPELEQALKKKVIDPNDPTGQNALGSVGGWAQLFGQRMKQGAKAAAYNAGFPLDADDERIQQLAGALKVMGSAPYMSGSRSMQMFNEAAQHLTDRTSTPEAMMQRLNTLNDVYPEFEQAVGYRFNPQTGALEPSATVPGAGKTPNPGPLSQPPAGQPRGPAAPAAPPQGAQAGVKPGDQVNYADIVARTQGSKIDPRQLAAQLKAEGVQVIGAPGVAGVAAAPVRPSVAPPKPPPAPFNPMAGANKASGIGPAPPVQPWTIDSMLHNLGVR